MAKAIETLSIKLEFKEAGTQQVLDKIRSSFKGLGQVITGNTKPAIQKLRNEINTFAATGNKSISTIESQVTALRALRREADINSKEFKQLTADISKYEKQLGKAQGRRPARGGRALAATQMAGAAISGGIFGGPEGFGGAVLGGAIGGVPGAFAGAAIGAQVGMIRQSLGGVAETVAEINSMKIALAGVSESAEDYRQSFNSVIEISKQFLFPVDKAIGEFTRLKAAVVGAGFGTKEATDVFKGFAAAILATGGNSEKLSGALLAASQVFSKGKVQAEELRGQIGERLPGAFTTFAQSIGVSSRDLDDMLRKGEVSTENFVEFTRTLFSRYEKTAETLGSSPEKAGQRLQLALSLATLEYGGFFQKVGAGFQDYLTNLVNFAVKNKETFKKVTANVVVFAQDVKDVVKGIVDLAKEAFGGLFSFLGNALKVFAQQIVMPFVNTIIAAINRIANRVKLGQAERKLGGTFGRAGEIRLEELEKYKTEEGITAPGRAGVSLAGGDEIERRAQQRILEEAGMGPKSREDRFDAALAGLDKAFAQFDPKSFGTSLGDKPLPGGDTGGDTGKGTKSTLARRVEQAQALESRMQRQLLLSQQQTQLGRFLAQQDNKRSALQEKIAKLKKGEVSDELKRATASAVSLQNEQLALDLKKKVSELSEKATQDFDKAIKGIADKVKEETRYAELLKKGINPERAKEIINLEKLKKLALEELDILIDQMRVRVAKKEATQEEIDLLDELLKKRKDVEETDPEDTTKPLEKARNEFEEFKDVFKKGLEEMTQIGPQLANVALSAIDSVTDGIVQLITTGKANFKEMAASILADIAKIMIRSAIAKTLLSFFPAANGAVLDAGRVKPYAQGGVVSRPTVFPMANGDVGLMGEAGPEAIMPLKRGPNGRLGVEVNNQGSAREAMNRYSRRSTAAGGGGMSVEDEAIAAQSGGPIAIDVRYNVERINNVDYVTASEFQAGMQRAASQGAIEGERRTMRSLQHSSATRRRVRV